MPNANRIEGCQSTAHKGCVGALRSCERCGKTICVADGLRLFGEGEPNWCDQCWAETNHYNLDSRQHFNYEDYG